MNKPVLENLEHTDPVILSKRSFLKNVTCGSLLAVGLPEIASASSWDYPAGKGSWNTPSHRSIAFHNVHTGEKVNLTYFEHGRYIRDAMHEISYALRDYHTDDIYPIDPQLIDQLHDLRGVLEIHKPFNILSAYRSPATNARLRRTHKGVARHSLHMQGRAIDIKVDGLGARTLRNAALSLRSGGVGYYPYANFVHLDTGQIRTWRK